MRVVGRERLMRMRMLVVGRGRLTQTLEAARERRMLIPHDLVGE